jgi:glucose/arabinose dehydrogenase
MLRPCHVLAAVLMLGCNGTPASDAGVPPRGTLEPPPAGPPQGGTVRLQEVARGLVRPLHLIAPAGDPRLFIVEQPGRIRIVENGQLLGTPFLDIAGRVRSTGNEQGLLSLAFHPRYAENGFFYVNYTDRNGNTQVERYQVSADRSRADPASAKSILSVNQPYGNHNGGHTLFGPDGMLYIAMGDGGSGGDPQGHGQNLNTLHGAILRIDIDGGDPYAIPADNPFATRVDARPEIWGYGVRNPWRIDFDTPEGLLYVADVGQNRWEEVHVVPMGQPGINYGWNRMEGPECFPSGSRCDREGLHIPQYAYPHPDGCSITGGHVYRGQRIPAVAGHYFFGDYCAGWIRSFRYANGQATEEREWSLGEVGQIMSFGEDADGELYVMSMSGRVHRFVIE